MGNMWYDKSRLLSYNSILNFLIGQRGGGKTYGFKTWCVDDFLKTGRQFIWLRRYNTELKGHGKQIGVLQTWFNDIAHLYPDVIFEVKGSAAFINGEMAGYFGALSVSEQWKSIPFKQVNKVIYDEFLIRTGVGKQYLKDEPVIFLELMETVGRLRDDVRYFLIGNALSFANPYFSYFNIKPFKKGFYNNKQRGITVELYNNDNFTNYKKTTKLGRLIDDTDYGDYAIENEFLLDNEKFIATRSPEAQNRFNVAWDNHTLGVWVDSNTGIFYFSKSYDPTRHTYTFKHQDHDVNMYIIKSAGRNFHMLTLKTAFEYGQVGFEDQLIKDVAMNILSKIV